MRIDVPSSTACRRASDAMMVREMARYCADGCSLETPTRYYR